MEKGFLLGESMSRLLITVFNPDNAVVVVWLYYTGQAMESMRIIQ